MTELAEVTELDKLTKLSSDPFCLAVRLSVVRNEADTN